MFDTHCHLNFPQFKDNWQEIGKECLRENINLIVVGCDFESSKKILEIVDFFEKGVYGAVGLHPTEAVKEKFDFEKYLNLAKNKKIVAVGEIGFDFWHPGLSLEEQKEILEKQIDLALKIKKPIIFHARSSKDKKINAYLELLRVLERIRKVKGVIHCFEGDFEEYVSRVSLFLLWNGSAVYFVLC